MLFLLDGCMMVTMTSTRVSSDSAVMSKEVEIERIMRTASMWLAAEMITVALLIGPAVAAGWRPTELPALALVPWWLGAAAAAVGAAALMWAGCPVPAFSFEEAHAQKVLCVRLGIVLALSGIALSGITVLFTPPS